MNQKIKNKTDVAATRKMNVFSVIERRKERKKLENYQG